MRARPFSDTADLRRMQRLVQDAWALVGSSNAWHVGDVAWEASSGAGREHEWARRLWEEGGRVVAWAWLDRPATLGWQLDPRRPELLDDVLAWAEEEVEGDSLETSALASDAPSLEILRRRGYAVVADAPWFAYTVRDLEDIPEPELPRGYGLRTLTSADIDARVDIHRAAWEPSSFTRERYLATRATWPYREDLDCVAEAADGSFASYTLCWYDEEKRVGEFEPVGTRPTERRRGLGRAVNLFALQRLRAAGAERAIVMCRGDAAYPIPKLLYESVGFRQHDRSVRFAKRRSGRAASER